MFNTHTVIVYVHNSGDTKRLCTYMSTTKRDKSPKGEGFSPTFQIRIPPDLREQLNTEAAKDEMSLGNWFKELARNELKRRGIEPKG